MSFVGTVVLAVAAALGGRWRRWRQATPFNSPAMRSNDPGELILVKKLLGKPYVAVAREEDNTDA
jgi:hypothetical protein